MRTLRIVTVHSEVVVIDEIDLESSRLFGHVILGASRVYRPNSDSWEAIMNLLMRGKLTILVKGPVITGVWFPEGTTIEVLEH